MTPLGISSLFKVKNPEIRALHLTWIAFFICFYTWFNMAPLATTMMKTLGWLSPRDVTLFAICNVALTIPARIFVGMAMDKWGPRRVYSVLMVSMAIPTFVFAFGNSFAQLLVSRLVLGCIGASFVIGIHMTSLWFKPKEIGFAEGIYAGWGNFGSAAAAMTLPSIAFSLFGGVEGWRYALASNGIVLLFYGILYWFAITDGPVGTVFRKPRGVASMEVSSWGDMIKLILWTIPMIGTLAILVWKIQEMGYLGKAGATIAYAGIAAAVVYQVAQVLRVNLPLLRRGVPEDDRYPFNSVIALNMTYMANFGAELAVVSMLPAFFEMTYSLSPAAAGLIASSFAFANLFARPLGGFISDKMKSRKRVILVYMFGITTGFFVMGLIHAGWPVGIAIVVTVLCSCFVQGAEGATFAIIPMIKRRLTGQIAGMAGAYGNVGAVVYLTIYSFTGPKQFFLVIASGALISFVFCLFFLREPHSAFAGNYTISSVDRDIEADAYLSRFVPMLDHEEALVDTDTTKERRVSMEVRSSE